MKADAIQGHDIPVVFLTVADPAWLVVPNPATAVIGQAPSPLIWSVSVASLKSITSPDQAIILPRSTPILMIWWNPPVLID